MRRRNLKKYERLEQLKQLFAVVGQGELTAYDVAHVLNLAQSTWLREMLQELVSQGYLQVRSAPHRKNIDKKLYKLKEQGR